MKKSLILLSLTVVALFGWQNLAFGEENKEAVVGRTEQVGIYGDVEANQAYTNSYSQAAENSIFATENGWYTSNGLTYYLENWAPAKGSRCIGGLWYRFDLSDGHMLVGSQNIDGKWYRYDLKTGAMLFGNQVIDGLTYRYDITQGYMLFGIQNIDGKWFLFDSWAGMMLTGMQTVDNDRYYYDPVHGNMQFGFQQVGAQRYYFDPYIGTTQTGIKNIDGKWYRFDPDDGHMLFGSQYFDGKWYRYDPDDGHMLFGSQYFDGKWYRYEPLLGYMLFGSQNIDGDWYRYDLVSGQMLFAWQTIDGDIYYYDPGCGKMLFGEQIIDGVKYRFHAITGKKVTLFRVYLDAGHGWNSSYLDVWDSGATYFNYKEADLTKALVDDVAAICRDKYGIEVVTHTDKSSVHYSERQRQAVEEGCSTFVSFHFNAGGGFGFESYIHSYNAPTGSQTVQDIMHKYLGAGITLADRGKKNAELAVTGEYLPATLLEVCFIDNPSDMSTYFERRSQVVEMLAAGINELSKHDECIGSGR